MPNWHEFTDRITQLYSNIKATVHGGANASYIPILEEANRDWFGISVCTVDGQRFDIGDTDVDFSIQSCVKPLMYAVAVEDLGLERVHKHVGIEPSGLAFNEVSLNEDGIPHNPMINPGVPVSVACCAAFWCMTAFLYVCACRCDRDWRVREAWCRHGHAL